MKAFWVGLVLLFTTCALAQEGTLKRVYGSHTTVCTQTAVDSTSQNVSGPYTGGYYTVYGYTSSTDFTGVAIKCLQGPTNAVTVNAKEGIKLSAGEKAIWFFSGYISCQTASGSGKYDVCKND